ncbi:hypothetical protein DFJ74DRAFT_659400 [Hyaloraphidium curvatum]|nr:hypothetical protein DFJ74DRAFT_659400 [Hyaloraphidium curvatum]
MLRTSADCFGSDSKAMPSSQVYATERIDGAGKQWHKLCFRCATCAAPLNLKNYVAASGDVYCKPHVPMPSATVVADPLSVVAAVNAPKRAAEGLKKTSLATGEAIGITLGALDIQTALLSPKPQLVPSGAVQKGDEKLLRELKPAEIVNASDAPETKLAEKPFAEIIKSARVVEQDQ